MIGRSGEPATEMPFSVSRKRSTPRYPPARITVMVIRTIQGTHISHLIQSILRPLTGLLLIWKHASPSAPAGHAQPHHNRPKKMEDKNIAANTIKLPFTMPRDAPWIITYGEKKFNVIGNNSNAINNSALRNLCLSGFCLTLRFSHYLFLQGNLFILYSLNYAFHPFEIGLSNLYPPLKCK